MRKINSLLRKNKRELDRSLSNLKPLQKKTELLIAKAAKAGDYKTARIYAKELIQINNQYNKLYTSRTRIESINMSINEQWQMNKLTQSIASSTSVMKDVNALNRIGVISGTMQELSKELTKAGIINEMMDDMVDLEMDDEIEQESAEEVNKIISTITENKLNKIDQQPVSQIPEIPQPQEPIHDEEDVQALDEMRDRLKALQE
jgi:charged multivesicular body protein 3